MSFFPILPPRLPVAATVTLNGAGIESSAGSGETAEATLRIKSNGTVYSETNLAGPVQLFPATNWVRPVSAASGSYECRYTNHNGDSVIATKSENVWHALSSDFTVGLFRFSGLAQADFVLEIRLNGGPVLASAFYSLEVEVGP